MIWSTKWKELRDFPGIFVSDDNRIFDMPRLRFISVWVDSRNQLMVILRKNNRSYKRNVNNLRVEAFAGF